MAEDFLVIVSRRTSADPDSVTVPDSLLLVLEFVVIALSCIQCIVSVWGVNKFFFHVLSSLHFVK